jgi:hypothetical protein
MTLIKTALRRMTLGSIKYRSMKLKQNHTGHDTWWYDIQVNDTKQKHCRLTPKAQCRMTLSKITAE